MSNLLKFLIGLVYLWVSYFITLVLLFFSLTSLTDLIVTDFNLLNIIKGSLSKFAFIIKYTLISVT